jgi:hypothetical protein
VALQEAAGLQQFKHSCSDLTQSAMCRDMYILALHPRASRHVQMLCMICPLFTHVHLVFRVYSGACTGVQVDQSCIRPPLKLAIMQLVIAAVIGTVVLAGPSPSCVNNATQNTACR